LVLYVYKLTKQFPKDEQYILTSQILRAVISITSNIAEGFARSSKKEKKHFYNIAKGSLIEVQNQLLIAKDLQYISAKEFNTIAEQTVNVSKLLYGLTKGIEKLQ